jgi:hypothetical protein
MEADVWGGTRAAHWEVAEGGQGTGTGSRTWGGSSGKCLGGWHWPQVLPFIAEKMLGLGLMGDGCL